MNVLENSKRVYNDAQIKCQGLQDKIYLKQRQVVRLENRIDTIRDSNWWGDVLILPLIEALKVTFPEIYFKDNQLIPLGMRNAISIFGSDKELQDGEEQVRTLCAITFTSGSNGDLYLDTGEYKNQFNIGHQLNPNGFNNVTILIDDIQVLIDHVDKQVNKKMLKHLK